MGLLQLVQESKDKLFKDVKEIVASHKGKYFEYYNEGGDYWTWITPMGVKYSEGQIYVVAIVSYLYKTNSFNFSLDSIDEVFTCKHIR